MKSNKTIFITMIATLSFMVLLSCISPLVVNGQVQNQVSEKLKGPMEKVSSYIYTISHWVGQQVKIGVNKILPKSAQIPDSLVDPIGFLVILTAFLAIAEVAKKITWFLVLIGWVLILIRVGVIIAESYI